jgi:hypothetical protein
MAGPAARLCVSQTCNFNVGPAGAAGHCGYRALLPVTREHNNASEIRIALAELRSGDRNQRRRRRQISVVQETRAYYVTPHARPYQNSVRGPLVIGRYAPRIAIAPARFYAYPYVSTFDTCVRWQRVLRATAGDRSGSGCAAEIVHHRRYHKGQRLN